MNCQLHQAAITILTFGLAGSALADTRDFQLHNPLSWTRPAADVEISREAISPAPGHTVTAVALDGHPTGATFNHPFQLDDLDGDGQWDVLYFQAALHGDETVVATVHTGPDTQAPPFPQRVDAMADAAENEVTKPAWESDLMGYCAYGAAQVDALGKVIPKLSLDFFYNEPINSQHGFTVDYGADFLSVSNTMGAHAPFVREADGTIARPWTTDAYTVNVPLERNARHVSSVVSRGPLRVIVETLIDNWTTDAGDYRCAIRYTIAAGQRHTSVNVRYEQLPDGDPRPVIGAGTRAFREDLHLEHVKGRLLVASRNVHERGMLVRWIGRAIVAADDVAIRPIDIPDETTAEGITHTGPNYGLLFPEAESEVNYAFIASWNLDGGITDWPQFQTRIERLQQELSRPVTVTPAHRD